MSGFEFQDGFLSPDDVRAALGRPRKERHAITVTIHGLWNRTPEEVNNLIDSALHERGLCGCHGPMNGYTMSVTEDDPEPAAQP